MKRGLLLLFVSMLVGAGSAWAACPEGVIPFPAPNSGQDRVLNSGACLSNAGQAARLRWDNAGSHELQLFDTDDSGQLLWCAHDSSGGCAKGKSACLQADGNMVIYSGDNCTGSAQWASNTRGKNIDGEVLAVADSASDGEHMVIVNHRNNPPEQFIFISNNRD
jgi:hypothetical protein